MYVCVYTFYVVFPFRVRCLARFVRSLRVMYCCVVSVYCIYLPLFFSRFNYVCDNLPTVLQQFMRLRLRFFHMDVIALV